jgi:hypothetical protein
MFETLEHDNRDPEGSLLEARFAVLTPMHDTLDVPPLTIHQANELVDWLNGLGY